MGEAGSLGALPAGTMSDMARILVVDNYDSFVFNLVQYLAQLGADVVVRRNDEVTPDEAREFDGVLLSPGPGTPEDAGVCMAIVRECAGAVPIFGVCLGHQAIAAAYGATVSRAPELLHGKTSLVFHEDAGVLAGLDLLITVDTAIGHLAGALGLPCWVLLRNTLEWRWPLHRTTTPWYPRHRLFRGESLQILQQMAEALEGWRASR